MDRRPGRSETQPAQSSADEISASSRAGRFASAARGAFQGAASQGYQHSCQTPLRSRDQQSRLRRLRIVLGWWSSGLSGSADATLRNFMTLAGPRRPAVDAAGRRGCERQRAWRSATASGVLVRRGEARCSDPADVVRRGSSNGTTPAAWRPWLLRARSVDGTDGLVGRPSSATPERPRSRYALWINL